MLFREGCGELSERFRAWPLCIKRSRNARAFSPISIAIAGSHSTSKGYSVTIPSLMGKATSDRWNTSGKDALSLDELVLRAIKRKPFRAVELGKAGQLSAGRGRSVLPDT